MGSYRALKALKTVLAEIPMWKDFAERALTQDWAASHARLYWRGPINASNVIGLPNWHYPSHPYLEI
jgi:hypothetical protein